MHRYSAGEVAEFLDYAKSRNRNRHAVFVRKGRFGYWEVVDSLTDDALMTGFNTEAAAVSWAIANGHTLVCSDSAVRDFLSRTETKS